MTNNLLYDYFTKHEVYRLLRNWLPSTDGAVLQLVLDGALQGPVDPDEHSDYARYNLLTWLTGTVDGWDAASAELETIQTQHAIFRPREHPDLDMWMSSEPISDESPFSVAYLHDRFREDPQAAMAELLVYHGTEWPADGPTWSSIRQSIAGLDITSPTMMIKASGMGTMFGPEALLSYRRYQSIYR